MPDGVQTGVSADADLADRIALFLQVMNSSHHELKADPFYAGIVDRSNETYGRLQHVHSFEDADRIATAQAIREVIASGVRVEPLEDALWAIVKLVDAFQVAGVVEPDEAVVARAREVLEAHGMSLESLLSASVFRAVSHIGRIARDALLSPLEADRVDG